MAKTLNELMEEAKREVTGVPPSEVSALLQQGYIALDIRNEDEFEEGSFPGAINAPRGYLEVKVDHEHPKRDPRLQDRAQGIVCFCNGGSRGVLAAKTLKEMGFEKVHFIDGNWRDAMDSTSFDASS
jgi:rhodanese-related sulfurtransferase